MDLVRTREYEASGQTDELSINIFTMKVAIQTKDASSVASQVFIRQVD